MKRKILFACLLFVSLFISAQNNEKHEIDIQLEKCLDSPDNYSTAGMTDCISDAIDAWDKELNKNYKLLMSVLSEEEKELLKKSQRTWITFRDNEMAFSNKMYINMNGSMWLIVAAQRKCDFIRQRTLELKEYYSILIGD